MNYAGKKIHYNGNDFSMHQYLLRQGKQHWNLDMETILLKYCDLTTGISNVRTYNSEKT